MVTTKTKASTKRASESKKQLTERKINALHQRLTRLTVHQANQLLGENSKSLLMAGGDFEIDPYCDVVLDDDKYRVRLSSGQTVTDVSGCAARHRDRDFVL